MKNKKKRKNDEYKTEITDQKENTEYNSKEENVGEYQRAIVSLLNPSLHPSINIFDDQNGIKSSVKSAISPTRTNQSQDLSGLNLINFSM
jgi:hypothetical protein